MSTREPHRSSPPRRAPASEGHVLLAPLEGSNGEVRAALAIRRAAMDRLARELGLRGDDARVRALGAQRSAAWWIAQRDASLSTLLSRATLLGDAPAARAAHAAGVASAAAPASHPRVGLCVLARDDGAVPRAAEAILRAHAPPAIDVFRAAPGRARGPEPVVDEALRERGLEPPGEPRSLVDAARAVAIVSVGEPPRLGEDFRGKRFHLWSTTPERPETLAEARDVFGQLTHQARCLVAEYRARLHPRT